MFSDKIKEATLTQHQQVEKSLVGKMKAIRSKDEYVNLLKIFYGYFGGLEQQIKTAIDQSQIEDYNDRRKTGAIAEDIKDLGGKVPGLASGLDLPTISNHLQAFGALYVIEGSTLGGSIISGMMQKHLAFDGQKGLSFFNGYGEQTQQMWANFKLALNVAVKSEEDEAEVLQAANNTFARFNNWIEKQS